MTNHGVTDEIKAAVHPVVEGLGFDVIDVQVAAAGRRRIVRILADRPAGGIALAECAQISRAVSAALDKTSVADSSYTLEVSSPGLGRPLETPRDFQRYVGERITLHLIDGGCLIFDDGREQIP